MSGATMRAARYEGTGRPLVLTEVPRPRPGPEEVLVRVAGCGFCHTDLHYLDHPVLPAKPAPMTLGHEISGRVAELGSAVTGWAEGAPVLVPAVLPCGRCQLCRSGRENICPDLKMVGNHVDGGYAEFVVVPGKDLVPLPPSIDLTTGAVIADALTTPFHAVTQRFRVRPGEWVVVVGCGGIGANVVQFARLAGAEVIALDLREEKLRLAQALGAAHVRNPAQEKDLARWVREVTGGGADVAIDAVGNPDSFLLALSTLRRGGRAGVLGYSEAPALVPLKKVMFFEYEIVGSLGCRPADYPRVIELVRQGRIDLDRIVTARLPLERIGEAADRLRRGEGLRSVIVP
jgi:6-hydroxycyclohex-1-ene-1-carbonyl-CoA dehydrogenase